MAQSIQAISPPSSLVTAFKSHANASEAPKSNQHGQNSDPFGPAIISDVPTKLSGASLSALKEVAATTQASTPPLPGYDRSGNSTNGIGK